MSSSLLKWLSENYPMLFIVLIVVIITFYFTTQLTNWKHRLGKAEKDCEKIDSHITPTLGKLDGSIISLSKSINSLIVYLKSKDGDMDSSLFRSFSPVKLTEVGFAVLDALDGRSLIDKNLDLLIKDIESQGFTAALDVQNYAPIAINNLPPQMLKHAKDYIYQHPVFNFSAGYLKTVSVTLDINTMNAVLGIYLRDKYLAIHKEITPEP